MEGTTFKVYFWESEEHHKPLQELNKISTDLGVRGSSAIGNNLVLLKLRGIKLSVDLDLLLMALRRLLALPFLVLAISLPSTTTSLSPNPKPLALPVRLDANTLQHVIRLLQRTPLVPVRLVLHLGATFSWVDCERGYISSSYLPVPCGSPLCAPARSFGCTTECYARRSPACNNNTCSVLPANPFTNTMTSANLIADVLSIPSTSVTLPRFLFSCAPHTFRQGLAKLAAGTAGLGWSPVSFPSQLAQALSLPRTFAICLASNATSPGVLFVGDGPYNFLPGVELSQQNLVYTPLRKVGRTDEYYIRVTDIKIGGRAVPLNRTFLGYRPKTGRGGTRFSTVVRHTTLRRSIYKAVATAFAAALSKIRPVKAVAPFGLCYSEESLGSTRVGPGVPPVEFVLHNDSVSWVMSGSNTMVAAGDGVLCLGFVDGGEEPADATIVVGTRQLEDNLVQFDVGRARVGLSSSLLFRRTTCSNYDFGKKA
ncbi:Basic 7S globulin [Apostasia shenzhenica]|uniref:Basic 7S globulin n=1 Tax=Apostasia shenzhenica TaxID=1088818 RepID=A0A2I0B9M9_9ASPA|nr:Basic 7S globulin [Apostasia shenzhenica]